MPGNYSSGRKRCSRRTKVEACLSLDINQLNQTGCLRPGWEGGWQWSRDGEQIVAAIDLLAQENRLDLTPGYGGEVRENLTQVILIDHVPRHFGGFQSYFICPRDTCHRRAVKLYGAGPPFRFLCRHCHRLVHASQYETPIGRAVRRARKIEQRLGDFPKTGKGISVRTYARLLDRALMAESLVDQAVVCRLDKLLEWTEAEEKRGSG